MSPLVTVANGGLLCFPYYLFLGSEVLDPWHLRAVSEATEVSFGRLFPLFP